MRVSDYLWFMNHRHFILHKPFGYLSQFVGESKKKKRLGELFSFPAGTMAIGRLDEASEGLLFLTTDGKLSSFITSQRIEKEYYVQVDGQITSEAIAEIKNGLSIIVEKTVYQTLPCFARLLDPPPPVAARTRKIRDDRHGPTSWVAITLTEGKNRQIRKMTAAVGFPTLRLIRVRIGSVYLGNLPPGAVEEVTNFAFPEGKE
jgi:23S rRNA pseudouridine2457 synthase